MKKIKTALLGYGRSGGSMHAGAIEKNAAFELTAVCDPDPARRDEASKRFPCRVYENYREMLQKEKLDLACVITRNDQHCPMTCACLAAGINVLVTKPWAVNANEARRMLARARKARKAIFPWLPARWGCDVLRLKKLLAEKAIGEVFLVRRTVSVFSIRSDWQTSRRYAGGYLLNWGPHIVDPPLMLMNKKVKSVYGRMKQVINPGDAEDLFMAVITLADGTLIQAELTISAEDLPSWIIQGTRGTITVRGKNLKLHKSFPTRPADPTRPPVKSTDNLITEEILEGAAYGDAHTIYALVAAALREKKPFPVPLADALYLSRVLDAIRASNEKNRVITLK